MEPNLISWWTAAAVAHSLKPCIVTNTNFCLVIFSEKLSIFPSKEAHNFIHLHAQARWNGHRELRSNLCRGQGQMLCIFMESVRWIGWNVVTVLLQHVTSSVFSSHGWREFVAIPDFLPGTSVLAREGKGTYAAAQFSTRIVFFFFSLRIQFSGKLHYTSTFLKCLLSSFYVKDC